MLYIHLEENPLPHLSNNKSEVQIVFSTAERSENLVSSHALMENTGDVGLSLISWQSYFHFHAKLRQGKNDTVGYIMITVSKAPGAY